MRFPSITNFLPSVDIRSKFDQVKEFQGAKEIAKIAAGLLGMGAIGRALYLVNRPIEALPVASQPDPKVVWALALAVGTAVAAKVFCGRSSSPLLPPSHFEGVHTVARKEKHTAYPDRQEVADDLVSWGVDFQGYAPAYYVDTSVLANDRTVKEGGWADPEDRSKMPQKVYSSFVGDVLLAEDGAPLNPMGRTGLKGRGMLGKWGANFAGDPIVTRTNPYTGRLEVLLIKRKDNLQWALPGGMVDDGEVATVTVRRELSEEAGVQVDSLKHAPVVFKGYVDDPRNTDNAWMETTAVHYHLTPTEAMQYAKVVAGDDAAAARWVEVSSNLKLYASHNAMVKDALGRFAQREKLSPLVKTQIASFK